MDASPMMTELLLMDSDFIKLNNDEDRAKFIVDKFSEYLFYEIDRHKPEKKNTDKSIAYREAGNRAFTKEGSTLHDVFDLYCKSIAYAVPGTVELSLGYANRSAVLFKAKFYEDCLIDIERAIQTGYPKDLRRVKLFVRKAKCIYALTGNFDSEVTQALADARKILENLEIPEEKIKMVEKILSNKEEITSVDKEGRKIIAPKYIPKLSSENPNLPGASTSIALKYSEKYGNHIVATRDIEPGEFLMIQKPYVILNVDRATYTICDYCTKQTWTGIPCDDCIYFLYCSEACKKAAWVEYHDIECPVFTRAIDMKLKAHSLMSIRLTIMAYKETGSLEALRKRLRELDTIKDGADKSDVAFNPNSYDMTYIMDDNTDKMPLSQITMCSVNSVFVTFLIATTTNFFGEKMNCRMELMKEKNWFAFIAGLTTKNMKISKTKAVEIIWSPKCTNRIIALVPLYCFFNHNCYSHTSLVNYQQLTVLVTPAPFKKDEQIFVCYGPHYEQMSKPIRQNCLKEHFQFTCDCLACVNNWVETKNNSYFKQGLSAEVLGKLIYNSLQFVVIMKNSPKTHKDLLRYIKDTGKIIQEFCQHVRDPCVELNNMLSSMSRLHLQLGNQYISLDE